jgi:PAS domain S-box-containing protein
MQVPQWFVRYGTALFFVGAALILSLGFEPWVPHSFLIFFMPAAMLAGWFGRLGAGLLAVIVSTIIVDYYFLEPPRTFLINLNEAPYFFAFLSSAVVSSWLGSARRAVEQWHQAHLDELFEQTPEAIMLVDVQDRVLRVNRRFSDLFGYSPGEAINRTAADLIVPTHLKREAQAARDRLAAGYDSNVETIRKRQDGSYLNVSEVSFPVVVDGKRVASYVILRDITESKLALDQLQKAQAELAHLSRITTMAELASSIAHEINQPIAAMVTNGDAGLRWLAHNPPNIDEAKEALESIVRDANRAAQVIRRIRSLLKKNPMPMVKLDLHEVIHDVLALTAHETNRRGIAAVTELTSSLPAILGDRVQLQQVLLNLIMNSIDAMSTVHDRPRQLVIKSSTNPDGVLIQVQDTGVGWEVPDSDAIFEPFFTTKDDGIGMGLAISRSIIETHGGRLWAERRMPYGASMSFTLPIPL